MIYTKTGDQGETSLVGGTRVSKCDARVEAYGTVDELNAQIGVTAELASAVDKACYDDLKKIQNHLFIIQTLLATEDEATYARLPQLPDDAVEWLEHQIDDITGKLPKNNAFVIPGGNMANAQCHVARTVCRRAERRIVAMQCEVDGSIRRYMNRLSDYLFVLSRLMVLVTGNKENFWSAK